MVGKFNVDAPSDGKLAAIAVFIEPASYILKLVAELRNAWPGSLKVLFLTESATQPWQLGMMEKGQYEILPPSGLAKVFRICEVMRSCNPKVVFVTGWGRLPIVLTILLARFFGAHVVSSSDTWQSRPGIFRSAAKRLLFRFVSHFAPGGTPQMRFLERHGVHQDRISRINMTVDVRSISRFHEQFQVKDRNSCKRSLGIPPNDEIILAVGRLSPEKDLATLIDAFALLKRSTAHLLVVGDGEQREHLERHAAGQPNVIFTGRLSGEALMKSYAVADVFVGSSVAEGWGLVVNEAMAASLPVVVTDRFGCVEDLVIHGETGLVVPAQCPTAMSEAILYLLTDHRRREAFAANAHKLISEWTVERQAQRIVHAWKMVVETRTHGAD